MPLAPDNGGTGSGPLRPIPLGGSGGGLVGSAANGYTPPPPSGYGQASQVYGDYNAGANAGYDLSHFGLTLQQQMIPQQTANQQASLSSSNSYQQAMLALQMQGNGQSQAALQQRYNDYAALYGVDKAQTGTNLAYQEQLKQFLNQQYGVTTGTHQSVLEQLTNAANQYRYGAGVSTRQVGSADTAAGSYTSQGHGQDLKDIGANLNSQLANNTQQTKQENLGYLGATITRNQNLAGINNAEDSLRYDLQRSGLSTNELQARLKEQMGQLDIAAQGYGLQRDQLAQQLQLGLQNLNLSGAVNLGQILTALGSNDTAKAGLAQQTIQQIMAAMGYAGGPPSAGPPGGNGVVSGGSGSQFVPSWGG